MGAGAGAAGFVTGGAEVGFGTVTAGCEGEALRPGSMDGLTGGFLGEAETVEDACAGGGGGVSAGAVAVSGEAGVIAAVVSAAIDLSFSREQAPSSTQKVGTKPATAFEISM